jgi:hypothetical protein
MSKLLTMTASHGGAGACNDLVSEYVLEDHDFFRVLSTVAPTSAPILFKMEWSDQVDEIRSRVLGFDKSHQYMEGENEGK